MRTHRPSDALLALRSLGVHRESPYIMDAVAAALDGRSEPELLREFESLIGVAKAGVPGPSQRG